MNPINTFLNSITSGANKVINSTGPSAASKVINSINPPAASNPSATTPVTQPVNTPVAPSNPVIKTPAAQTFINTLTPDQKASNDAMTKSGVYTFGNDGTTTKNNPVPSPNTTQSSAPTTTDPYLKYLTGLFDPTTVNTAKDNYVSQQQRLADIQSQEDAKSLAGRHEADALLDTSGMLKGGAQAASSLATRRSNSELADLAVQESAAARSTQVAQDTYNMYINAGKSVYDAQTAAAAAAAKAKTDSQYTLGQGQTRFDANGNPIASVAPANTSTGVYVAGQNPSVDAWIKQVSNGTSKITDVPAALKNLVVQGLSDSTVQAPVLIQDAYTQAQDLLNSFDTGKGAVGAKGPSSFFGLLSNPLPGTAAADYKQKLDSFKAKLSLDAVKYLKGQGAVSDSERKLLEDSVTELSTNQSEDAFKKTLTNIVSVLGSKVGSSDTTNSLTVTDPTGGVHTFTSATDAQNFKNAIGLK